MGTTNHSDPHLLCPPASWETIAVFPHLKLHRSRCDGQVTRCHTNSTKCMDLPWCSAHACHRSCLWTKGFLASNQGLEEIRARESHFRWRLMHISSLRGMATFNSSICASSGQSDTTPFLKETRAFHRSVVVSTDPSLVEKAGMASSQKFYERCSHLPGIRHIRHKS